MVKRRMRKSKISGSFQFKEKVFLRQQGSYILTVEAGKQLLLSADSGAEATLQAELAEIQEKWKSASVCLEEQKKKLAGLLQVSSALPSYGPHEVSNALVTVVLLPQCRYQIMLIITSDLAVF